MIPKSTCLCDTAISDLLVLEEQLKLSERRVSSPDPGLHQVEATNLVPRPWDKARSCHCCLNRSATVRQKV